MREFDDINEYVSVSVTLASPSDIRGWSSGEVTKPETINYRTYRPEKDGLFCEKIFGPVKDWECFCGKYKGIKYKGVVCDRCGVKITLAKERRVRMGHINLVAPVVHIWFFKSIPNRLSALLDIPARALDRIIYYQDYVVTNPGKTPLEYGQILSEEEYVAAYEKYGNSFKAEMGAEAIRTLLKNLNLAEVSKKLREEFASSRSEQRRKEIARRLKLIDDIKQAGVKPEWIVLDVIPVIPPDLRPLVPLENGNFATSDLNDLYRRVINRNNRLKRLMDLKAPDVILRNEKRMLQHMVDVLFDNSRCRRPVLGRGNRQLKSLTDMIRGKQGRFRENLLGKRVDYSGRSVIVVGPELKLYQCGLPKYMALEMFQPFVIRRLRELGYADTIKAAKKLIERGEERIWDILDEVIKGHPVLLNRAPTLHRMSIQAFEPVLIEGNAIQLHPLVCAGFNADFDGDTMAVHVPLSVEAIAEARMLMMSTRNILSPAHGKPIIGPSQDIVLGVYYLTVLLEDRKGAGRKFASFEEAVMAYESGVVDLHAPVEVCVRDRKVVEDDGECDAPCKIRTTVGRILFNEVLPEGMAFFNMTLDKGRLSNIIYQCYDIKGQNETISLLDRVKDLGFRMATKSGMSFAVVDMKIPENKYELLERVDKEVERIEKNYQRGVITAGERYNQILDAWTHATEHLTQEMLETLKNDVREGRKYINPIYAMAVSAARGGVAQLRQLAAMRGLMAKPSGRIIETPIRSCFREGLSVLEYFSSTHGARKGLADTALKTADAGYLTRKLIDVAQNVIITEEDCGTIDGITKGGAHLADLGLSLKDVIVGRVARDTIVDVITDEVVVRENEIITEEIARRIEEDLGYEKVRVRSPLTCEARYGICARCYGVDLATGRLVERGAAVGIVAAQSIGEPGTQLTMRTFHLGGTASRFVEESRVTAEEKGVVKMINVVVAEQEGKNIVINRGAEIAVVDKKGRELERHHCPVGAWLYVEDGQDVKKGQLLVEWDPYNIPILTEYAGIVRFEDIVVGETVTEEVDKDTGVTRLVVVEHKGDLHPQIVIEDARGNKLVMYPIPERAIIEVDDGQKVKQGDRLAKTPREIRGTQDITGGLPRVTELFEARKPKSPAVISEIDGVVEIGERKRGKIVIRVRSDSGMVKDHLVPRGKHIRVATGQRVKSGDPLIEGPLVLQDILSIRGEEAVQQYLLREIQAIYRSQGVSINDKHIEIIIRKMMNYVKVMDAGDTNLVPYDEVEKVVFNAENQRVVSKGGRPAKAEPVLMGITRAALKSDSFLAAASFQQVTRVLTEAALAGAVDHLRGLKENVIIGRLVPVGTGERSYFDSELKTKGKLDELIKDKTDDLSEEVA